MCFTECSIINGLPVGCVELKKCENVKKVQKIKKILKKGLTNIKSNDILNLASKEAGFLFGKMKKEIKRK